MDYTGYLLRTAFLRAAAIAAREFGDEAHPRDAAVLATLQARPALPAAAGKRPERQPHARWSS